MATAMTPIKAYFKYSMELLTVSPVMAYYCKLYGVNKGFEIMKTNPAAATPDVKKFLMEELADLEKLKANLGGTSKDEHQQFVENFVLSVFAKIDKDERTCEQITKQNAVDFKRCSDFIQMMGIFGELDQDWKEKDKYCKYKAGNILKCMKTGEVPQRGNPFVQEEEPIDKSDPLDFQENVSASVNNLGHHHQQQEEQKHHQQQDMYSQNTNQSQNGYSQNQNMNQQQHNIQQQNYMQNQQVNQSQSHGLPQYNPNPSYSTPGMPNVNPNVVGATSNQFSQMNISTNSQPVNQYQNISQSKPAAGAVKKDANYYKAVSEAKKKAQNAISELEFNNVQNAIKFFKDAIANLQQYEHL